jgi:hypothetical protein
LTFRSCTGCTEARDPFDCDARMLRHDAVVAARWRDDGPVLPRLRLGIRIHQDDDADFTTDVWGTRELAGDVTVVLDSSQESESDSVAWIRLEPVAG